MIREKEVQAIAVSREARAQEFNLAERMLNVGIVIVTNTTVKHPDGDARAGRVMLGLYGKMLNNLLSIVILSERGQGVVAPCAGKSHSSGAYGPMSRRACKSRPATRVLPSVCALQ